MRCGRPGKPEESARDLLVFEPQLPAGGGGEDRVLRIMGAAQRARAFERAQQLRLFQRMVLFAEHDVVAVEVKAPIQRALRRDRRDALIGDARFA